METARELWLTAGMELATAAGFMRSTFGCGLTAWVSQAGLLSQRHDPTSPRVPDDHFGAYLSAVLLQILRFPRTSNLGQITNHSISLFAPTLSRLTKVDILD